MDIKEKNRQIYEDLCELVEKEQALRQELNIGDRYRAIPSRLKALVDYVKQIVFPVKENVVIQSEKSFLSETQQYVYVYLYNAKGKILSRWESMLSPRNLMEYSVNRPIYAEKAEVDAYIRSRSDDDEHAYLMMRIEKEDIILQNEEENRKDPLGQPLLKLKEKALQETGFIYFFHRGCRYAFLQGHLVLQM